MKYWFYSEGNILGPYDPAEMLALPAFAEESLVCPETATGDNPGDWRPASQMAEIASALSFGSGRTITAGVVAGAYEYETGFNSSASYFENKEPATGASYGELLDTIDNILGAYKEGPAAAGRAVPETDYDLAEKFDIRLSHIQEELEAARWEKNLLLEKIRSKEMEEKKNQERINELEARLKSELGKSYVSAREFEQLRHLADLKEKAETVRQIEEIKREEHSSARRKEAEEAKKREEDIARKEEELKRKEEELKKREVEEIGRKVEEEIKREEQEIARDISPVRSTESAVKLPLPSRIDEEEAVESLHAPKPEPLLEVPAPREKAAQADEAKSFKSISRGSEIKLETSLGRGAREEDEDLGMTSRSFKSLGQTQPPAYVYGSHYDKPLSVPEAAPAGAFKPEAFEPLPQQAGGIVYDFTVVTSKPAETSQQFQIETRYEAPAPAAQPEPGQAQPVKPPTYDFGIQEQAPAPFRQQPAPAQQQAAPIQQEPVTFQQQPITFQHQPAPIQQRPAPAQSQQVQHGFQFQAHTPAPAPQQAPRVSPVPAQPAPVIQSAPEPQSFSPSVQLSPAVVPSPQEKAPAAASVSSDVTTRIASPYVKGKSEARPPEKTGKKGGRMAFITILVVFGSMAAGGLGYFFMGEGVSFSEFSMLSLGSKKKTAAMDSQLEGKPESAPAADSAKPAPAPEVQPAPEPQPVPAEKPANENIKKALEIVKGYKLSGGRGSMATWFANSFLTGASGGANEEWTATPLHGDILVVQYRLLRPRQEPLIYQFEVDAAKRDIVRGINNNAIELLDFSSKEKSVSAAPAKKPAAKPKVRKPSRPGAIPILPLPDAPPAGGQAEQDPTGFENVQAESSEQVKYLKAQESDEELF